MFQLEHSQEMSGRLPLDFEGAKVASHSVKVRRTSEPLFQSEH